ncbi:hypothetical protein [Arthrobacter echini]|uniref:hypothetical protein n=1 Tax=Arthrobacter echini TaxID=1529066 RepID=UPI0016521C41|nr:hypothetical protein [Arthrobacter echini]
MVFSLDSSLVLVAVVGLWLVWVAPSALRRGLPDVATTGQSAVGPGTHRSAAIMMMTTPQDLTTPDGAGPPAEGWAPTSPAESGTSHADPDGASRRTPSFALRRGRLAIAVVGLVALTVALVTLLLGVFGIVSLLVPLICLALGVASIALLRVLAVRARRARVDRAFADAMGPAYAEDSEPVAAPITRSEPVRATTLFDAEEADVRPLTPMELRTAALAQGSSAVDVLPEATDAAAPEDPAPEGASPVRPTPHPGGRAGATAWVPVEVPRPTYVDAAKAERVAPLPLDLPEAPKASTTVPIKAAEAAVRRAAASAGDVEQESSAAHEELSAPAAGSAGEATAKHGPSGLDLDGVLQRRRA